MRVFGIDKYKSRYLLFLIRNKNMNFKTSIDEFIKNESGQDLVEVSLLLVLIAAVAVTVLTGLGTSIVSIFTKIKEALDTAASTSTAP